ncbi:MAG: tRNA pseudouridine(55) synthase TruB [Planctomycetota bacterium]
MSEVRRRSRSRSGGIAIWKPVGITSRAALEEAERALGVRPLGHTGTLDPLACGILVLLGGEGRKFQELLVEGEKEYRARLILGMGSGSDDAEGPLWSTVPRPALPALSQIDEALDAFRGGYRQAPPRLSAVRVDGRRAYDRARRGEEVDPPPRPVRIDAIEVEGWEPPLLELMVRCGPGAYLRSLARDLGERLACGGFLAGLRRTALGSFREADAVPLFAVAEERWLPLEEILTAAPRVEVSAGEGRRLSHGQEVRLAPGRAAAPQGRVVTWSEGRVRGLAEVRGSHLYPRRWLAAESASS